MEPETKVEYVQQCNSILELTNIHCSGYNRHRSLFGMQGSAEDFAKDILWNCIFTTLSFN